MRAIRDEKDYDDDYDDYRPSAAPAPRRERRLVFEIALGVWLGGVALAVTSGIGWYLYTTLSSVTIQFGAP